MALVAFIVATVVNLALAALLISVSGFVIGSGPESMRGGTLAAATITAFVVACVVAPIVGFALRKFGRPVGGILVAWLPAAAALFMAVVPL